MFKFFNKNTDVRIQILLHCPDGFDESVGFNIPSETEELLKYVNIWSKKDGYSVTLSIFDHIRFIKNYTPTQMSG